MIEIVGNPSVAGLLKVALGGKKSDYIILDFLSFGEIEDIENISFKKRHWIDYNPTKEITSLKKLLHKEKKCKDLGVKVVGR